MKRSTWLHLRIPFSFFLLPVFLFAISILDRPDWTLVIVVGMILHLLLYPASNGYNSYFDKDEGSIGGLKHPPEVSKELYWVSLLFDGLALLIGIWIGWQFALLLLVYGLASKAYSHPAIRLKKMPVIGWIIAGFFQGYFTFLMVVVGVTAFSLPELMTIEIQLPAILSSLLLWGSYPMTQIYQHEEDAARGDQTISLKLGVLGTFHFTALMFSLSNAGFLYYYFCFFGLTTAMIFQAFLLPMLIYFFWWYFKVRKDRTQANFDYTMRLNILSAVMLNTFFLMITLAG